MSPSDSLRRHLFAPQSVAIVGQSDDPDKTAGRPLKFLRRMGFPGRVYPINPRRAEVLGERAWPSLDALPEVPEHVYVVTPTEAAVAAVEDCARLGVAVASVLADGFAESGPAGLAREERLRACCVRTGLRLVGPSCLGVVDLRSRAMISANAALDEPGLAAGRVFCASHSGSLIGTLLTRGKARGIDFAGLVSVGNEVDLSLGEICAATLDDPGIDGYMLFLETLRHADALRRFARAAAARGKPVLAYKLGRSAAARELAVSHTGALAGEDDVADAFLRDCGIARVDTLDGLIEGLPLLLRVPPAARGRRRSVGAVTTTAGGATMVIDPLASRGVAVEPASAATLARLAEAGIAVKPARLIDLTIAGARYDTMKRTLDILLSAPEFDLMLAVVGSSARAQPQATVQPLIDSAGAGKPLAAFIAPEALDALAALRRAGVPCFHGPEACADAIAAALARRPPRVTDAIAAPVTSGEPGRVLDELAAGERLERLGIPRAPSVVLDATIAQAPPLPFPYPVAVKVLSEAIAHKTDVGGVVLGVRDAPALLAAIATMRADVAAHRPGTPVERVLVQPMLSGLGEALIGYRVDRDVGPIVMVAAGGVLTEISRDRSLRLAPVDVATAREMIAEVRGLLPLSGYRGRPPGDLDALAHAVAALSRLAEDAGRRDAVDGTVVLEAEINPLIVREAGVAAVDALVRVDTGRRDPVTDLASPGEDSPIGAETPSSS